MSSILSILFAALFTLSGIGGLIAWQKQGASTQRAAATATQLQAITAAAQLYVQANAATLQGLATATAATTVSIPVLQAGGYLSPNIGATNPYGQTWTVQVLQPTAGTLQALVISTGGLAIPNTFTPTIAAMTGASGGFIPAAGQYGAGTPLNTAIGAYNGWTLPMTGYGNPGAGHVVSLASYSGGALSNSYLNRVAVPGQPALTTMQTALNMGGNALQNATDIASTGTMEVAATAGGNAFYANASGNAGVANTFTVGGSVALGGTATSAAACSPNGSIAASSAGTGALMVCVSGKWTGAQSGSFGSSYQFTPVVNQSYANTAATPMFLSSWCAPTPYANGYYEQVWIYLYNAAGNFVSQTLGQVQEGGSDAHFSASPSTAFIVPAGYSFVVSGGNVNCSFMVVQ